MFATTLGVESYLDLPGAEVNRQPSQELCGTSNEGSEIDRIQTHDASDSLSAEGSQIAGTFGESDHEHSLAPPHRPDLSLLDSTLVFHAPNALILSLALKIFNEQNFLQFLRLWRHLKYAYLETDTHWPNSGPLAAYLEVEKQPGLDPRLGCVRAAITRCQKAKSFAPPALRAYDRHICQHNAYITYIENVFLNVAWTPESGPDGSVKFLASDMTGSNPMKYVSNQLHTTRRRFIDRGKRLALLTASFGTGVMPLLRDENW